MLAHVLVRVPEQSSPEQIEQRRAPRRRSARAGEVGQDFAQVAATWSDAPDAQQGGNLGWRTPARMPSIFVDTVRGMKKGEVSDVLRSPAGFHIVKLIDERSRNQPAVVQQTHVRHILIKVNELTSDVEAKAKIDRVRERIEAGAKFEDQARVNSEDASSAKGGDLGWVSPATWCPISRQAMDRLKPNESRSPCARRSAGT